MTQGGDYGEPLPLGERIHVHMSESHVPTPILNAFDQLRIIGTGMAVTSQTLPLATGSK